VPTNGTLALSRAVLLDDRDAMIAKWWVHSKVECTRADYCGNLAAGGECTCSRRISYSRGEGEGVLRGDAAGTGA
jgi:hypothetical protein